MTPRWSGRPPWTTRLVDEAASGEPFVIAKSGRPMVRVVPIETPAAGQERRLGFLEGRISVPDDFDRDPFDRILVCQARVESCTLLTADDVVAAYGAPVRRI